LGTPLNKTFQALGLKIYREI